MAEIRTYTDVFEIYELRDETTDSWVKIAPERGGMVFSYGVRGREVLYLDKETFHRKEANVRGGIPVLFPICGQLHDGKYEYGGRTIHMNNHGVARTHAWTVDTVHDDAVSASITLRLSSSESTMQEFPFAFELLFKYVLNGGVLTIEQTYVNQSDAVMPMYAGFHPYFQSTEKDLTYTTDATRYLDYNDMQEKPYRGHVDMGDLVESIVFLDAKKSEIAFPVDEGQHLITMTYGPEFRYVVLWTVAGKPFICVEPWMAKTWALNTGEGLVHIEAGASLSTQMAIRVDEVTNESFRTIMNT